MTASHRWLLETGKIYNVSIGIGSVTNLETLVFVGVAGRWTLARDLAFQRPSTGQRVTFDERFIAYVEEA